MIITGKQIGMARILLDMNQANLANTVAVARKTIMRIENGQSPGSTATLKKIRDFFENNDLVFTPAEGVARNNQQVKILRGSKGFLSFMNDVYDTARIQGGDICISNVDERNWLKWMGQEKWDHHNERISKLPNVGRKIIVKEKDKFFIANKHVEYRWFPAHLWSEQTFYAYGDRLGLFDFTKDNVRITVLKQPDIAQGFRVLFDNAWNHIAIKPPGYKKGRM